jgi:hypothetical protein
VAAGDAVAALDVGQGSVNASLDVKVQIGERRVKLAQLRELTDRLQRTLAALASQLAGGTPPGMTSKSSKLRSAVCRLV